MLRILLLLSVIIQSDGVDDNEKTWLISCAFQEIPMVTKVQGGKAETLNLPAVIGNLKLTCYSTISCNITFGYESIRIVIPKFIAELFYLGGGNVLCMVA